MNPIAAFRRIGYWWYAVGLPLFLSAVASAQPPADKPKSAPKEQRAAVGQCVSPTGALLHRRASGQAWQAVQSKGDVFSVDQLLALPGEQAAVDNRKQEVRLTLWGNLPELSSFPVLESAVVLHANPAMDLDVTLDRGRVLIANLKKNKEPARVRVGFQGQIWELVLEEPGTEIALDLYGRWPTGTVFRPQHEPDDLPITTLLLFVLKGQAAVKVGAGHHTVHAPPGPAHFHWINVTGADLGPRRRDRLPAWADKGTRPTPEAEALRAAVEQQRRQLADKPAAAVLVDGLNRPDTAGRQLAVYGLAAIDDLPHLVDALADIKHAEVREAAILALQHWIGRGAAQERQLHNFLVKDRKYTAGNAEIVLFLLHGISQDDLDRPETYEALIAYLRHNKLPVRDLARWQLYRLVPAGKDISYDPAGNEASWERAYKEWKVLIPDGKLPKKAAPGGKG
jgi:hypothetical protein